ncbi:proton-coupled amino acid transporter 1 [Plakobranchus ocellatus]|uniref:Proton-coupled amino acid transporter 1 n=1 Tax=Plakobranchus ocellatus TaxID=259542 RepID=A0AAV4AW75_9GAST|nr:proton-coupled amino acid transporter 1 [Plakobranchus ocellatus]
MAVGGPSSGPGTDNSVKIFANIFIAFIGAGVLGLPYSFKEAGILEGSFIMALVGIISGKAMLLLVECKYRIIERNKRGENLVGMKEDGLYASTPATPQEKQDLLKNEEELVTRVKIPKLVTPHDDMSYGDVGFEAMGSSGRLLVDGAVVTSQIGFCCAYLIFICKNLSDFVPSVDMVQWLLMILPPVTLLTLLRSLNSLAFTSLMAQCSNLFAFGVVFWFDFEHFHEIKIHPREISLENLPFFFVIAIYCYEGAGLVLSLESSLAKEVRHKFSRYFVSTLVVVTSLYIAFGVCGYLSFGPETNQIITLNLPKGTGLDFSLLVKSCLCVALFCTYPVMMFPVMRILEHYFIPDAHKSFWKGNVLRGLVVLLTGMVVIVIPNFADLMALVGATCCTFLAFVMPGLFHMKLFQGDLSQRQKLFDWTLICLGILGTILGLWDALGRISTPTETLVIVNTSAGSQSIAPINVSPDSINLPWTVSGAPDGAPKIPRTAFSNMTTAATEVVKQASSSETINKVMEKLKGNSV